MIIPSLDMKVFYWIVEYTAVSIQHNLKYMTAFKYESRDSNLRKVSRSNSRNWLNDGQYQIVNLF